MNANMPTTSAPMVKTTSRAVDEFFARVDPPRSRLIFALDATASRQSTWDTAAKLTARMFDAVNGIGALDLQLAYYCGPDTCVASRWFSDARSLTTVMSGVLCRAGETQIERILIHGRKENQRQRLDGLILISDACEEDPVALYAAARHLATVPVFMFQEGQNERVAEIYAEIARITKGAVAKFDTGAAQRLADLLRAVAVFATGGIKALGTQDSDSAKLLLTQLKNPGSR